MNLNQRQAWIFLYSALLVSLLAMLLGFDGIVSLQVTPFNLRVVIDGHPTGCLIDPQLPEVDRQSLAQLPEQ
ncbi:MAG: hypothetical protein RMX68_009500 [Aulosira sp. ZfuVER01]|nr:hypothetical protein [Aulosira sp. ZfuVER01]MDZ7996446.1 hypothetical protein [Aulosira sp. DedVER01a]MDZ8050346.1 hypothetical protein [Aulosira sp. ZfuCHP01]